MNDLFNEQYELLLQDLQEISNPYERAHVRALLLGTLAGLAEETPTQVTGKDAIKNDIAKPIEFEEETTKEQESADEEVVEEIQPQSNEPRELDLDHDPAIGDDNTAPIIVQTEDGELDVTEAYNLIVNFTGSEDEKLELAMNITLYNLTAIYESLSQLKNDCHNKMMLAYYLSEYGLAEINGFVAQLTDDTFNEIYEFINDENLDGFILNIENAIEEE